MPYIHPAAREHELRRWMRPDAHRFVSPTWRRVVQAGSEAAAIFGLYEAKYRPDQPRVPKGVPEGGQWTDDAGAGGSRVGHSSSTDSGVNKPSGASTPGLVMSDATPDPVKPGVQYAQLTRIEYQTNALTGIQKIDQSTVTLANTLARVIDVLNYVPDFGPAVYGTEVHTAFAAALRLQSLPGIEVEPTFGPYYGAMGSVRPDAVLRNDVGDIVAMYDVKTGERGIEPMRAARLRSAAGVGNDVPVFELSVLYGVQRKAAQHRLLGPMFRDV